MWEFLFKAYLLSAGYAALAYPGSELNISALFEFDSVATFGACHRHNHTPHGGSINNKDGEEQPIL